MGDVVMPKTNATDFHRANELEAEPCLPRARLLRIPKVFVCGAHPLVEGVAWAKLPSMSTFDWAQMPLQPLGAIHIPIEDELMHHPTTDILATHHSPTFSCSWADGVGRRYGLVRRQAATPVGVATSVPAIWVALGERLVAAMLVREGAAPAPVVALAAYAQCQRCTSNDDGKGRRENPRSPAESGRNATLSHRRSASGRLRRAWALW
mmetsp:Transcript_115436/g.331306  ORF Transcript_115436/g.331306 Transcript_115436/m.331306 type:complete len:208 (-) Transcript_115436:26-649(-)